jgi:cytochrome c553
VDVPRVLALMAALSGASVAIAHAGHRPAEASLSPPDFTRDVAPLLAARCFTCHGPDASTRKAGLRLDTRDGAVAASRGGGRAAIVPGNPDASELIARVTSVDPDDRMPPVDGHVALDAREVAILREWIAAGAPYAKHWSWQPLPPGEPTTDLLNAPPEGFARMDDRAWLRRVHFDVVGLPPSPDAVAAFDAARAAARTEPEAHAVRARVVDALLASPGYGERWARHWMDVMRFAETHGHEFDYSIAEAWRWRDWAIRAFNADVPYAQFVREQLAGDLLAAPRLHPGDGTNESLTATGWWWMSQGTHAPVDVRLDQAERIDNQVDVATKAFLGTTASCARCHDHKFDDVSQRDYYALFGVVRSSRRAYGYQDPHGAIRDAAAALRAASEAALAASSDDAGWARAQALKAAAPAPAGATWTFDHGNFEGWTPSGWAFGDAPLRCGDRIAPDGRAPVTVAGGCAHSAALSDRLHGSLRSPTFTVPAGPIRVRCHGRAARVRLVIDGFFLDDRNELLFEGFIKAIDHAGEWRTLAWDAGRYAGEQAYLEVIDDGDGFVAVDWVALAPVPEDACTAAPASGFAGANATDPAGPASGPASPAAAAIDLPAPVRVLAMQDGTGLDAPLSVRGVPSATGPIVARGMIRGLRSDADPTGVGAAGSGRLALAEEVVAPTNPLTWRVMANRVWHHMMGRGIVASTDDFGVLGAPPEDRALLDELAMRLRSDGSVKALVRAVALSPRYADAARPVRRIDAEALRDAIIETAGGLDRAMGGPSVPVHLTDAMQGRGRPAESGPLDGARRRSVYVEVRRNFLSPFLLAFDLPVPATTAGVRGTSNVPGQSLTLMNDRFVREQAERWGAELARSAASRGRPEGPAGAGPDGAPAVAASAILRAYARPATDDQLNRAAAFLGPAPTAEAWSDLAHALLLSAEFRYLR